MPVHTGIPGLLRAFESLRATHPEFVLATIVETAGSTYRKAGARMLITADGAIHGLLSGGCLEADLCEHARKVFESRSEHTVFYDMRSGDDLIWGLGLGCDGAVRIRLEHLSADNDFAPLFLIRDALERGVPAVVMTVTESGHNQIRAGNHYLYTRYGPAGSDILPPELLEAAAEVLATERSSLRELSIGGQPVTVFFGMVSPPVRLLIAGAGPDAAPVTEAAALLGWEVTVTDHRESSARAERFPAANRVVHCPPEALRDHVDTGALDAAVLMTHKLENDQRYLARLAEEPPAYIGLLGPRARKRQLLEGLGETAAGLEDRIFGPVGLDIGAELPEEIAVSLIAEIQAVLRDRRGGHLSQQTEPETGAVPDAAAARSGLYAMVLAAGGSARFGALKQLLEFNGQSLLRQAAGKAREVLEGRVVVVHGPKATRCQREIAGLEVENMVNEEWESGMASSLKAGLKSLPPDCPGALILLCDQPLIEAAHLDRLIEAWCEDPSRIAAAHYAGGHGVPAIIPRRYFQELLKLTGDSGAKPLLAAKEGEITAVALEEAELDIDTQADYEALLTRKLSSG
jgi:xanthine dehydrogenase accessory factor